MRRTLIAMLAALALSLALCAAAWAALNGAVDEAQTYRGAALTAVEDGRRGEAKTALLALAQAWKGHRTALEMLAPHEHLHEVQSGIAEAQICLERGDDDECLRVLSNLGMALEHIREEQALRWENLY